MSWISLGKVYNPPAEYGHMGPKKLYGDHPYISVEVYTEQPLVLIEMDEPYFDHHSDYPSWRSHTAQFTVISGSQIDKLISLLQTARKEFPSQRLLL